MRHGETVGDSSIRLYGATDVALSELGERQIERAAAALAGERFDAVVVSPLQRSRRSGALLAAGREPAPRLVVVEGFREINFGRWEGWTFAEAAARDPDNYRAWARREPEFEFPGGETRLGFRARVCAAITDQLFPPGLRVLGALHKGIIKILIGALTGMPFDEVSELPVALGGIYRLRPRPSGGWALASAHETAHLGELFRES